MALLAATVCALLYGDVIRVKDVQQLRTALGKAVAGTTVLLEPGDYPGGISLSGLSGAAGRPIVIGAADPKRRPRIVGGGSGMHFSDVRHLELRDLELQGASGNGLNIDDGGTYDTPSHHVTLRNLLISDLPRGNNDGIKLSGVQDFRVENCQIRAWGGSAVDMVGCHRGVIAHSEFRNGGDNAVQCKGGTSQILIRRCRFEDYGQRGVNIGGSTGLQYFRPAGALYEAKGITVEGCTFVRGTSPIAFVGVDGARVQFNTIFQPERWAVRILQETTAPGFVASRNGVFADNLVVLRPGESAVNIGPGTAPETFVFARNFWATGKVSLPSAEKAGVYGGDPLFRNVAAGDFRVKDGSPAAKVGAHALPPSSP